MKKLVASVMLLLYFVVSTGFVVSIHYCMDEVNAVELGGASERDECGRCGMTITDNEGCRKDEVKVVKVQADQLLSKLVKVDFLLPAVSSTTTAFLFTPLFNTIETSAPVAHGPPLSSQDTYLQNCVFRI